jgi:hypothetical protein
MYKLGAMGRLNSKSRKVLICSPKAIAAKRMMIKTMCQVPPKFDPHWMEESLHRLKKQGSIPAQWICQNRKSPVQEPARVLHFYGSYAGEGNKIRGWNKLNGMVVPI